MIIKNKIDNEPVLSNVGEVGEFRIRNSAKAFNILSSGLYANKIRAIIREYSCNAVDSHVEAGRGDLPFDVHLPNTLEPWFSIRDYGVGLDEQQVRNIFTTYFESTKTATDELIGGLGLGSKSAFSFTDNFTIVAVKNGVKRVYTAFINDHGVPSIAPMGEEATNEPTGVEIRFAVEDSYDFRKFHEEARHVYKHFKLRPVISGVTDFKFIDPEYEDRDIIPGVHAMPNNRGYNNQSYAIMGNIEYPIAVPSNQGLDGLEELLRCGLVIEFAIGELDIQASREGLSYIPETVAAIKTKLEALNAVLADKVAEELNAIRNPWEKAYSLRKKLSSNLWATAAKKFAADTKFDLIEANRYGDGKTFLFSEADLAKRFNIKINAFRMKSTYYGDRAASNVSMQNVYDNKTGGYRPFWAIQVDESVQFVENDTTVGVATRAKYHWKNSKDTGKGDRVFVLDRADKKEEMNLKAFYRAISNPPAAQKYKASTLMQKERASGIGKDVSILHLEKRDNKGHMRSDDMVWRDAGALSTFDDTKTYYYLPMSGFTAQFGENNYYSIKDLSRALKDSGILTEKVYGVRKADLDTVKGKANWVNLDEYLRIKLPQQGALDIKGMVKDAIAFDLFFRFAVCAEISDTNSPYLKLYNEFAGVKTVNSVVRKATELLFRIYNVSSGNTSIADEVAKYKVEMTAIENRYPLLIEVNRHYNNTRAVVDYINAIDLMKK